VLKVLGLISSPKKKKKRLWLEAWLKPWSTCLARTKPWVQTLIPPTPQKSLDLILQVKEIMQSVVKVISWNINLKGPLWVNKKTKGLDYILKEVYKI
jgi:hypothetical protein